MDMDEGATKWMLKYARKNFWRVHHWYDFDDLAHDGYMTFYRIRDKYPAVTERKHLMSLFQRSFINHIHDISNARTRQPIEHAASHLLIEFHKETSILNKVELSLPPNGPFQVLCTQAPKPVQQALQLFTSDAGLVKMRKPYRRKRNGYRETMSDRLTRLTGYAYGGALWFWSVSDCGAPTVSIPTLLTRHFST